MSSRTVIAQVPRLAPFVGEMRGLIAVELACTVGQVWVKATRTERLEFAGSEEGIAALASVLLLQAEFRQA